MNHFPRLASDPAGRVWLSFRHRDDNGRAGNRQSSVGRYLGRRGHCPRRSRVGAAPAAGSERRHARWSGEPGCSLQRVGVGRLRGRQSKPGPGDEVDANVQIAALTAGSTGVVEPLLAEITDRPSEPALPPVHPNEAADIARMRNHRIKIGGKAYQPLRGDFHRHTEISFDGGGDGALEDMWRYAVDCAGLDWIGNGDHDNGNGKEYTWWITQKTMELYHAPPAFTPCSPTSEAFLFPMAIAT